jgi:SAM-dependent methyltransferase
MEHLEESLRLEIKTDPEAVRKQALWCGLKPGFYVLDAGCGSGKVTSILHDMVQPGGKVLGIDYSKERIRYAEEHYGHSSGIRFGVHDLREPIDSLGPFDLIWVRFVLEYNLKESPEIVRNLSAQLKPGGCLCLMDLDHNCLNHYELPSKMELILPRLMRKLEQAYNFDPYAGRKLYAYLYDLGYQDIQMNLMAHHLIYGEVKDEDIFNWIKKVEVVSMKTRALFEGYPGGHPAFFSDFKAFFLNPRRFTYTPLILCKGTKPATR